MSAGEATFSFEGDRSQVVVDSTYRLVFKEILWSYHHHSGVSF
jgi:hypothetical protein